MLYMMNPIDITIPWGSSHSMWMLFGGVTSTKVAS